MFAYFQSGTPTLSSDKFIHNFGIIEEAGKVNYAFILTNSGRKALKISNVVVSCGCIEDAHVENNELAPGQKTKLFITWDVPTV